MSNDIIPVRSSAYDLLKQGRMDDHEICIYLMENQQVDYDEALKIVNQEKTRLNRDVDIDLKTLLNVHTHRYRKLWVQLKDRCEDWIQSPEERADFMNNAQILSDYKTLLKSMRQEEQILGLKRAGNLLKYLNNDSDMDTITKGFPEDIEIEKLSFDEQVELMNLIMIARGEVEEEKILAQRVKEDQRAKKSDPLKSKVVEIEKFEEKSRQREDFNIMDMGSIVVEDNVEEREKKSIADITNFILKRAENKSKIAVDKKKQK